MSNGTTELRKLAAIMFTDMVGYSALAQRNEALALKLLDEHRALLRSCFVRHPCREIETTGDGFFIEFESALAAVQCALEIQKALGDRNAAAPSDGRVEVRIGIHVGDLVHRDRQVLGDGVNIAARIEPHADPGGICVSEDVARLIQGKISARLVHRGQVELKNIQGRINLFAIEPAPETAPSAAVVSSAEHHSIAVLPFVNMSSDAENEYLTDGITEDLISALSKLPGLRVPARTSAFAFKDRNEDIRKIGKVLNVSHVLEGSARRSGHRLRVTAQLVSVSDGYHLWSERYDREMEDVFAIQDDISLAIVEALKLKLIGARETLVKSPTESTEAYQYFVRGRHFCNQRGIGMHKALHLFELARLEDPNYALAYAGVADCYSLLVFYGFLPAREAVPRATAAARKALQLDPSLAEPHSSLGFAKLTYEWDWAGAGEEFRTAIELNPNCLPAYYWLAAYYSALGRHEEALRESVRAVDMDPLSPLARAQFGWRLVIARRFDRAVSELCRAVELDPKSMIAQFALGQAYEGQAAYPEAIACYEKAAELSDWSPWMLASLGHAYAASGQEQKAREILQKMQAETNTRYVRPFLFALVHLALGEIEPTFHYLNKAREEHEVLLPWINVFFFLDVLRPDPRFQELLRTVGLLNVPKE